MAKGLRSSVKKANKARLRAEVFGPAELARKERLSAKLLELAVIPSVESSKKSDQMDLDIGQRMLDAPPMLCQF